MGRPRRHHAARARGRRRRAVGPQGQGGGRAALESARRRDERRRWRPTTPISAGCRSPRTQLVDGAKRAVEREGFRRIKLKVGHDEPMVDIAPARGRAQGDRARTSAWPSTATASGTCRPACASARAAEALDVFWFEEPLWYDDVALARGAGALDDHPRRARRAALYARCVPAPSSPPVRSTTSSPT